MRRIREGFPEFLSPGIVLICALSVSVAQGQELAAWYTFDDGTATDVTGNGNDGIFRGTPRPVPGAAGFGLELDGPADGIRVDAADGLDLVDFNISLWIRPNATPKLPVTILQKLSLDTGYTVRILSTGAVEFEVTAGETTASVTSPFPAFPGVWTAIAASHDAGELRLYLHGELAAKAAGVPVDTTNAAPLHIGREFQGRIDEVQIGTDGLTLLDACIRSLKIWVEGTCLSTMTEVTHLLGIGDTDHLTFGGTLVDIDQDGWLDLYYVNGLVNPDMVLPPSGVCPDEDPPAFPEANRNVLHMNRGDGTFFPDSAPQAGIDDPWNAMRHAWADYDNDGRRDLISHNFIVSTLYRHVSPDPLRFESANDAGDLHVCLTSGTGASWVDVNNDGFLDLHVVEYDHERAAADHVNRLFLNDGDGTFTDITSISGLDLADNPMGQLFFDYDNDGDQDVFMTNSHEAPTRLYRNDGAQLPGGIPTFTDVATEAGVLVIGEPDRGFGAAAADFNNDGFVDLLFINERDSRLFRNDGPGGDGIWTFTDVSDQGGLDFAGSFRDGAFADLDNDGWQEILLANFGASNQVYRNNHDGTWMEVAGALGMANLNLSQAGVLPGDTDNDGDLDVVFTTFELGDANTFYENEARGNNWMQLRLTGVLSNRDAVGARIQVTAELQPGEPAVTQIRDVVAGTGFFADIPRIQTFGMGKALEATDVRILWPSGITQELGTLAVNRRHDVEEVVAPSGAVPGAGIGPQPLRVRRQPDGALVLSWSRSCADSDDDYAVYEGTLGEFASHLPRVCSTGGATAWSLPGAVGNVYFLVVPNNTLREGSYGVDTAGLERAPSSAACKPQSVGACP